MNLRNLTNVACGAVLLAGVGVQQVNAQVITDTFTHGSFLAEDSNGDGDVFGGAFDSKGNLFAFEAAPTGPVVSAAGVIDEPLSVQFFYLTPGLHEGFVEAGTGHLKTIGDVSTFTLDPGAVLLNASSNTPFLFGGDLDFTFTGTPTASVVGTTSIVNGIPVITGSYASNFGTGSFLPRILPIPDGTGNGVVHLALVPEPGTVSLLAGLAVTGSGFVLRRRRRAA